MVEGQINRLEAYQYDFTPPHTRPGQAPGRLHRVQPRIGWRLPRGPTGGHLRRLPAEQLANFHGLVGTGTHQEKQDPARRSTGTAC